MEGMLFFMQGKLWSATMVGGRVSFHNGFNLIAGDYNGEELISWALDPNSSSYLPISSRTVRVDTKVEAFSLMSDDVRAIASLLSRRFSRKQLHDAFRNYSHQWRTRTACFILAAWRRYRRRKLEEFQHVEENRLQGLWVAGGGFTSRLGATIYPSRFGAHANLAALRNRQVMIWESAGPLLLLKPRESDFRPTFRKVLKNVPLFHVYVQVMEKHFLVGTHS